MSDVLFSCKIEVSGHGILKNSKQLFKNKSNGKMFIASSDKANYAKNLLNSKLLIEKLKQRIDTITCDINAALTFYYPKTVFFNKNGKRSNRVGDLSNLYELPQDCLQKAGILLNDSLICSHDGSSRVPIDESKYYLEIILRRI